MERKYIINTGANCPKKNSNHAPFSYYSSVNGKQYFECPMKYGSMIPVNAVEIGDFPPENDGLDDEEL